MQKHAHAFVCSPQADRLVHNLPSTLLPVFAIINHHLHPLLPWSPIDLLYPKVPFKSHSAPRPPQTPAASS